MLVCSASVPSLKILTCWVSKGQKNHVSRNFVMHLMNVIKPAPASLFTATQTCRSSNREQRAGQVQAMSAGSMRSPSTAFHALKIKLSSRLRRAQGSGYNATLDLRTKPRDGQTDICSRKRKKRSSNQLREHFWFYFKVFFSLQHFFIIESGACGSGVRETTDQISPFAHK